jgi:hypothetical protein
LLTDDDARQSFYQALGVASWSSQPIDELKSRLTLEVLEKLLGGVSETTRSEHVRIFEATPRGTLAQTFYAIGAAPRDVQAKSWRNFHVILAHDDRLMNVSQMLRFFDDLGLAPNQVQVVRGDHYLFSVSSENPRIHWRNREIVLGEILYLHEVCRERQRL